jgi:hypothetical protein
VFVRVRGFPNYLVNDGGWVVGPKKKLKGSIVRRYLRVTLYRNKKHYHKTIHRLVAEHFLNNPKQYPCVNHRNANKLDNRAVNLEWCTWKMNSQHAAKLKLFKPTYGEKHYTSKLTEIDVRTIRKLLIQGVTSVEVARRYNVYQSTISDIKNRVTWKQLK